MTSADLLVDAFDRIRDLVHRATQGLTAEQLGYRVDKDANSIAWLVWHLTRIADDHIAGVAGVEQAWTAEGWVDRFGLPFDREATGWSQSSDEVAAVQAQADLLMDYHDAVHARTVEYVKALTADDFDRVVDKAWDPPVTLGVRLISIISDDIQHAGQAAFVRGIVERL